MKDSAVLTIAKIKARNSDSEYVVVDIFSGEEQVMRLSGKQRLYYRNLQENEEVYLLMTPDDHRRACRLITPTEIKMDESQWLGTQIDLLEKKKLQKQIRFVKKGHDDRNLLYWLSLSVNERMAELERIRQQINKERYGTGREFQRVYRVIKRA